MMKQEHDFTFRFLLFSFRYCWPCVKSPLPATDLPEAKQLRLCLLSKTGLRYYRQKSKSYSALGGRSASRSSGLYVALGPDGVVVAASRGKARGPFKGKPPRRRRGISVKDAADASCVCTSDSNPESLTEKG